MRKFADIFLVFLLTLCAVFASYFVAEKAVKTDRSAEKMITVSKVAATEKDSDRVLLCENNKRDYHFYKQGEKIVMVHKGVDYFFENWSQYIDVEKPKLYFRHLDEDPVDKIVVKAVSDINEDGSYVYGVYILSEIDNEDGTLKYKVNALTRASTKQIIDETATIEVSQSKICKKTGYIAMCHVNDKINYDRVTGVPSGAYYNAFHILQSPTGEFYTIGGWDRGAAEYTVEKDGIYVMFPITIRYKDTDVVQQAGYVKCMLSVNYKSYYIYIMPRTMSFKPNMEYGAYRYDYDDKEWRSVWKNANKSNGGDKVIDYVQFEGNVASELETEDFSKNSSDLNKLLGVVILQDEVLLYAKKGYSFKKDIVKKNEFSVRLTMNEAIAETDFDVAYTASISQSSENTEILTIKLDQPYKRENISKIKINFGVK
ncbi:hypothetical protein [Eubacterium sp.]